MSNRSQKSVTIVSSVVLGHMGLTVRGLVLCDSAQVSISFCWCRLLTTAQKDFNATWLKINNFCCVVSCCWASGTDAQGKYCIEIFNEKIYI